MKSLSATQHTSKTYRADIDGLRAVAVLAVVAGHYFPELFPQGLLGVDIFFVISGFVITQLVFSLPSSTLGSFLLEFYARRVRRLAPALVFVVLLTFLFSFLIIVILRNTWFFNFGCGVYRAFSYGLYYSIVN